MSSQLHPLLHRLLRKAGARVDEAPTFEAFQELLALVSRTFNDSDHDRYTLERSIEVSSREMQALYQDLKRSSESELAFERARVAESLAILRATLEVTHEGLLVVDRDRHIIAHNKRFLDLMNVPEDVMATRDHRAVVAYATRSFPDPDAARLEIEKIHEGLELVHDEVVASDRIIERYSAPVSLPDGTLVGRVTFFRDVTDERNARSEVERAREAAEAASHAKTMFLANMSHELRTPLNAVIGLADLLLLEGRDPLTKRQQEYLEGITQSGRHLLAMVNDVLDLAKIEAGKHALDLTTIATGDAIEEAVSLLQPLARTRGVELIADVERDAPALRVDPMRLRQILYNLISNAVKFTNREGAVRVSARSDSRGLAIRVEDTGIGIAPEDMTRLFREFEQLNLPSGDRPAGTGLGLALTRRLVVMHGGTIDVSSRLGHGSIFTVRLPVA